MAVGEIIERANWKGLQPCVWGRHVAVAVVAIVRVVRGGRKARAEGCKDLNRKPVLVILSPFLQRSSNSNPRIATPKHSTFAPIRHSHRSDGHQHTSSSVVSSISARTRDPTLVAAALRTVCISVSRHPAAAMAPPCPNFPAQHLSAAAQIDADGKVRKTEDGRRIDLARDCELFGLAQYECIVRHPELVDSPVQCWPVQRWFRRWVLRF